MKRVVIVIALLCLMVPLVGCKKEMDTRSDAVKFKEEYESLNKQKNDDGVLYRTITIDEKNPIVYIDYEGLANKIADKESFLVYFGKNTSEQCRSVVPYLVKQAITQGIDVIYYVDITTKEEADSEGTKALDIDNQYYKDVLNKLHESTVKDSTLAVFVKGEIAGKTSGMPSKEIKNEDELTGEMKDEILAKFKQIYITYNSNRE